MQIYYDLQNQSKLVSVQSPPIDQALQLKGHAPPGTYSSSQMNIFNQKPQKQIQVKNPPHFKINTNLQLHDTLGQSSPFALGIRPGVSPSAHLIVGNFQMNQTNQAQRQTQQASSNLKTEHGNDNVTGMSYIMSPNYKIRSKNSSEEKNQVVHNDRMSRNMENLTSMKLVGGSSRLNQLINLMSKQDQKKQRLKTLEQLRMNNKQDDSQHLNSITQITGQVGDLARNDVQYFNFNEEENQDLNLIEKLNQKQTLRKKNFNSNSKQKTTIHVVISVSNSNESLKGLKDGAESQIPTRNSKRVGSNIERNVGHLLSKIQSVQRLDQKIDNSSQIDLEINSYTNQPINITQPSSTMIHHTSGNKQAFDEYTKQFNKQKQISSNLIQFPQTAKNLKGKHLSVQFNQQDIQLNNGKIQPINLLSKQGIGYSASKKSLIKLPAINQKQESQNLLSPIQFTSNKKFQNSPQSAVNIRNEGYAFVTPNNNYESISSDKQKRSRDYTKASLSKTQSQKKNILGSKKSIAQIQNARNLNETNEEQKPDNQVIDKGNSLRLNLQIFPKDKATNKISLSKGISPQTRVLTQVLTQKPSQVILQNEKFLQSIKSIRNFFGTSEKNLSNINSNQSLLFQPSQSQINNMLSNQISQQSLSQSNNDQSVNYNLLNDDAERNKLLMKLFNKKLSSIGVQKQIIDQIIQKGAGSTVESRFEPKKGSLGKAGIQGELMNLQMVIAQQEIENKAGGHILAIAPKIDLNLESIKEVKQNIVKNHQESIETLVNERQKKRDVLINTSKHLKALNLIEQVENNIRKKKGSMNVDLSIDQNKIKYGKVKQDQSELSKLSEYLQNEQKKKKIRFIDKFDFSQFNDADYDSDFAEQITLNAIHIDESNIQKQDQNQKQSPKSVQKIIPLLQKSPQVSSFKGTKFDKLINSPIDQKVVKGLENNKKYRTNQDGSIIYSQEQISMIKEKTEIADLRVNQKINFDNKVKEIQNDPNLLEDANIFQPHEWSVDSSKEYPGTIKLTVPITQTLNRKQANLIFKEDFEMKIVDMNNQIQKEIDETNKSLNFSKNLVGPHPTYLDMIDEVEKKEASRVKMLLAKSKQHLMKDELNEDQNPFQLQNHLLLKQSTLDLNDSIYNTIDQSLENSVETPKMNIQDQ